MLENVIPRVLGWVPPSLRSAIIGPPDHPSHFATLAHNFLNRLAPSGSLAFPCHGPLEGYRMCIDWKIYRGFVYGTWEPKLISVVADIVKKGMTVIDVGAHIGYYSLYFAKCVGPSGQVFSFEPVPENLELLRKNIELNRITWIRPFPDAVYSSEKEVSIAVPEDSSNAGGGSVVHDGGSRHFLVAAITLDSFCNKAAVRPDLIKMDVEGAEYDVLLGARNVIERFHPRLLIELHHFDGDVSAHPVPGLLESYGYAVHWLEHWQFTSHILATFAPAVAAVDGQAAL